MNRIVLLNVALMLAICSRSAPVAASIEAQAQTAPQPAATVKPIPAQLPDVVARVNGDVISRAELDMAMGALEARAGHGMPDDQRDRIMRDVLDQLIGYRLLVQESAARKIVVSDTDLDARVAEIRTQFPSEQAFHETLKERNMTPAMVRSDAREGIQVDRMIEAEVGARAAVTPEQVAQFYAQNPSEFQRGERVRASHILIRLPEKADAAAKEQARERAAEVLKEVKAGGDFAALAKQHSQDPGSAVNGGDLGFFERGQMVGPFEETAFSLAPSQSSDLVETTFGFHILKVIDREPAQTVPLAEVGPRIQQYLEDRNREQQTEALIASLKAKGKVDIYI